jgi:hypothetical protein
MHNSSGNGQSRRGARPHVRWLVSGLMAIGLMFGAHWGRVDAGTGKPLAIPDLTGDWVSNKGDKIHIDFSNLTGTPLIVSTFLSGTGKCPYGDTRCTAGCGHVRGAMSWSTSAASTRSS